MNLHQWTSSIGACCLATALFIWPLCAAQGQQRGKIEFTSSVSFLRFDREVAFESALSWGLGAAYEFSDFFQLGVNLTFTPTRQQIKTATETLTPTVLVYNYYLYLRLRSPKGMFPGVRPFAAFGVGGEYLDPHPTRLTLADGMVRRLDPRGEQKVAFHLGGGLNIPLSRRFLVRLAYSVHLYRLNFDDGFERIRKTAQDSSLGWEMSVRF